MTDETAQATEQNRAGGDDLDALLKEYDAGVGGNSIGNGETAEPDLSLPSAEETLTRMERANLYRERQQLDNERNQLVEQRAQQQYEEDLKTAVTEIRGDLNPEFFDDQMVTAWLDAAARTNPRLQYVFVNRFDAPDAWTVAKNQLAKDFQTKYSKMPDPEATADRNAVTAAIRAASGPAQREPPPNYSRQTNAEYRAQILQEFGYDPGV
jgi:flagellar hook protein FlgE